MVPLILQRIDHVRFQCRDIRGIAGLATGAAVAQIASVVAAPIIARIYTPGEFGTYTAIISLAALLSIIATLRIEQAVLVAQKPAQAIGLVRAAMLCAFVFSLILTVAVFALMVLGHLPGEAGWLLLGPIVYAMATQSIAFARASRVRRYGVVATTNGARVGAQTCAQVGLGLLSPSSFSLLSATLIGYVLTSLGVLRRYVKVSCPKSMVVPSRAHSLKTAMPFVRFTMPAALLEFAIPLGVPLALGVIYGADELGSFAMAWRLAAVPALVIGASLSRVQFQRFVGAHRVGSPLGPHVRATILRSVYLGAVIFGLLWLLAPVVVEALLGGEWLAVGDYVRIMSPWLFMAFVAQNVWQVPLILGRNRFIFLLNVLLAIIAAIVLSSALLLGLSVTAMLVALSAALATSYGASILLIYRSVQE